jgi:antitoxin (DNA-binding transcriptional repressor) of toxin-antitoxin stability system
MKVSVAYARKNLPALLKAVERGAAVTISRYREPIADLVPTREGKDAKARFGTGTGKVKILDPDWHKPIETEGELVAFLEGRPFRKPKK